MSDVVSAARGLRRRRLVAGVAIASIAVGAAANTTVFSVVHAIEFPRLLYPDASRIVFVESRNDARGLKGMPLSAPDAADVTVASRTLRNPSISAGQSSILRLDTPVRMSGRRVSPRFFDVMGVSAATGRVLGSMDREGVVVISDRLWRSGFGANPAIVGGPIRLDGGTVTVVGIMPPRFDPDADFWTSLPESLSAFKRDDRQFELFARLAPGVSIEDAGRELAAISARLALEHPSTNGDWIFVPVPLTHLHGRDARQSFLLLQAAVGVVMLIVCANVANLLLARAVERRREVAVRMSLGADRSRVIGGVLTEALLLSAIGSAAGILLSIWGVRLAKVLGDLPDPIEPRLNPVVLGFSLLLTIVTGVLCGIGPALRASSIDPEPVLRENGRGGATDSRGRLRSGLAAVQIAAAVVLAASAGLMLTALANRERVNLGFEPRAAARADLSLAWDRYPDRTAAGQAVNGVLDRLRRLPSIAAAGASTWALPTGAGGQRQLTLPGQRDAALPSSVRRGIEAVTPGYFEALGVAILRGRAISEIDRVGSAPVAVVNEELARRLWPDGDPIGELLRLGAPGEQAPVVTVVGVVATIRRSPMHDAPIARVYVPFGQYPNPTVTLFARARADVSDALRSLPTAVHEENPAQLVERLRTMETDVAQFVAPLRLMTTLIGVFAVTGVLLAALGVFGAMSCTVAQRLPEMAVRAALGADRAALLRLVLGRALRLTAVGVSAGVVLALWVTRLLRSYLFGVGTADPLVYGAVGLLVVIVSMAACYRPARAAATADPLAILRG